jgi:hypothetical protein
MPTPADTLIVVLLVLLPVLYFYKDSLPLIGKPSKNSGDRAGVNGNGSKGGVEEEGDPRDWLEQMNKAVSCRSSCVVEERGGGADVCHQCRSFFAFLAILFLFPFDPPSP